MRVLQICLVLLAVNFLVPTLTIHFLDVASDDAVCELLEDFGEEEEDGETNKDIEDSFFFREWQSYTTVNVSGESISKRSYPQNNASLHKIALEVQTPPPEHTMS